MNKKIYLLSLGCPRNLVDSEVMLGILRKEGFEIVDEPKDGQVALINSCSFIDEATSETIDSIIAICQLKGVSHLEKVIVCGCFVQRFGKELLKKLPEVDGFLGTNEVPKIGKVLKRVLAGERVFCCFEDKDFIYKKELPRYLLTAPYVSYLKISEGCRRHCSYCIIPKLKGKYRSRPMEDIVREAECLSRQGCKEFNVIGQDTTYYGFDLYKKESLSRLLRELTKIKGVEWIRLLYTYPHGFTEDLIKTIASSAKICKYVDIPIQHISRRVLKSMNRLTTEQDIINLIKKLRKSIGDVCLRSTILVGFPGETETDFERLLAFMKWAKFERLGIFKYSKEKGTSAASFAKQIPEAKKKERFHKAYMLQRDIAEELNKKFLGKRLKVVIDEVRADFNIGRTEFDAPEVDGVVYVRSHRKLKQGSFVNVEIIDTLEYDLVGRVLPVK